MKSLIGAVFFCFCCCVNSDDIRDKDIFDVKDDIKCHGDEEFGNHNTQDISQDYDSKLSREPHQKHKINGNHGNGYQDLKNYKNLVMNNKDFKYGDIDCKDNKTGDRRQGNLRNGYHYDEEERQRLDAIFGYTGPTANDEPENIIHPCALNDWQCIRKYFAANSKCTPAYGPIPDPLTLDLNTVFFPIVNVTITFPNFSLRGLSSARVSEFYVNKKSGNLVFAIYVQNLSQITPRAYLRYRRTAKESIILADYATFSFRSVTFTAVLPKVPNLQLNLADVHVDAQDGTPAFFLGPGAYNSTDPDVITAFAQFPVLLPVAVQEGFFFQSPLFTAIYIQKNICDFGLKIISL